MNSSSVIVSAHPHLGRLDSLDDSSRGVLLKESIVALRKLREMQSQVLPSDVQGSVLSKINYDRRVKAYSIAATGIQYKNLDSTDIAMGGVIIPLINAEGRAVNYKLDQVIDLGGGMKAYGLVAVEGGEPPILLIPGTFSYLAGSGAWTTVKADFNKIGYEHFLKCKEKINEWLSDKENVICIGHSLGGTLAKYAGIWCENIKEVHAFCSPSINNESKRELQRQEAAREEGEGSIEIVNHDNDGDIIPHIADVLFGRTEKGTSIRRDIITTTSSYNAEECHEVAIAGIGEDVRIITAEEPRKINKLWWPVLALGALIMLILSPLILAVVGSIEVKRSVSEYRGAKGLGKRKSNVSIQEIKRKISEIKERNQTIISIEDYMTIFLANEMAKEGNSELQPLKIKALIHLAKKYYPEGIVNQFNRTINVNDYWHKPGQYIIDFHRYYKYHGQSTRQDVDSRLWNLFSKWRDINSAGFFQRKESWDNYSEAETKVEFLADHMKEDETLRLSEADFSKMRII